MSFKVQHFKKEEKMKKYIIKKALVPVVQVVLDSSVTSYIDSINFRIDGNRITNKISKISFELNKNSLELLGRLGYVLRLHPSDIVTDSAGLPVGWDLNKYHAYLVKDNVIELRKETIVSEEI